MLKLNEGHVTIEEVDAEIGKINCQPPDPELSIEDKIEVLDFEIASYQNLINDYEEWRVILIEVIWGSAGITLDKIKDEVIMCSNGTWEWRLGVLSNEWFYSPDAEDIDMLHDIDDAISATKSSVEKLKVYREFITPEPEVIPLKPQLEQMVMNL